MPNTKKDRSTVAGKATHEIATVQKRMKAGWLTISFSEIRAAIQKHGHSRKLLYLLFEINHAAKDLLYISEGDHPFEVVSFKRFKGAGTLLELLEKGSDTKVEVVEVERFFEHQEPRIQTLKNMLLDALTGLKVYRVGETAIDVFVVGRLASVGYVGVRTKVIET